VKTLLLSVKGRVAEARQAAEQVRGSKRIIVIVLTYLVLAIGSIIAIFPFLYIVSLSLKESKFIFTYPPQWIPDPIYWGNYLFLFTQTQFPRWMFNTLFVATSVTVIKLFIDSLAGYAFAKMDFPYKELLFYLILLTLMVPFAATLVPVFLIVRKLNLADNYLGLILPPLASPIGIFMMRGFIESLPNDLENAARLDGCSEFQIYRKVILPLTKPALAVLGIFLFMTQWVSFIWPLVVAKGSDISVMNVGLASLKSQHLSNWGLMAAGSVAILVPIAIVFIFFGRWFVAASIAGALKE